jgi:hypothetical protein
VRGLFRELRTLYNNITVCRTLFCSKYVHLWGYYNVAGVITVRYFIMPRNIFSFLGVTIIYTLYTRVILLRGERDN